MADDVLELVSVLLEASDALGQQVGRHLALVHLVPEALLGCVDLLQVQVVHLLRR